MAQNAGVLGRVFHATRKYCLFQVIEKACEVNEDLVFALTHFSASATSWP